MTADVLYFCILFRMIHTIPADIIGHIGQFLPVKDALNCVAAAKCFSPIMWNVTEFAIEVNHMNNHKNFTEITRILRRRMPNIECIVLDLFYLVDLIDVNPIVYQIRSVLPRARFKAKLRYCVSPDRIIHSLPNECDIYLSHMLHEALDTSLLLHRRFEYMFLSSLDVMHAILADKRVVDNVLDLVLTWGEGDIDLTNVDPAKTSVTVYHYSSVSVSMYERKDLYKIRKLRISSAVVDDIVEVFSQDPQFRQRSLLREVEILNYNSHVDINKILDCIPLSCMFTLLNVSYSCTVYLCEVLAKRGVIARLAVNTNADYRVASALNMITKRNHPMVFDKSFTPSPMRYKNTMDIWDHMEDIERCQWGYLMYMSHIDNVMY